MPMAYRECDCNMEHILGFHMSDCNAHPNPHNPFQTRAFVKALYNIDAPELTCVEDKKDDYSTK